MADYPGSLIVRLAGAVEAVEVTPGGRIVTRNLKTGALVVEATEESPPPPNAMGVSIRSSEIFGDVSARMVAGDTALWTVATTDGSSLGSSSLVPQDLTGATMYATFYSKNELAVGVTIRDSGNVVKETLFQTIPTSGMRNIDLTAYGMHGEKVKLIEELSPRAATAGIVMSLAQIGGSALTPTEGRAWRVGAGTPGAEVGWQPWGSWDKTISTATANEAWTFEARFDTPAGDVADSTIRTYEWRFTFPSGVIYRSIRMGMAVRSQAAFAARWPALGTFRQLPQNPVTKYPRWKVSDAPASELAQAGDWTQDVGGTLITAVSSAAMMTRFASVMNSTFPYGRFFVNSPAAGYTFSMNEVSDADPLIDVRYANFRAQPGWRGDNGVGIRADIDSMMSSLGTDGHGVIFNRDTGMVYDGWKCIIAHDDQGVVGVWAETGGREAGLETVGDFIFDTGSVSASGCTVVASSISLYDMQEINRRAKWNQENPGLPQWSMRGAIPHMLTFTAPLGAITWRRRSWPAKSNDGWGNDPAADMLMEGQRMRLDPAENPDLYVGQTTASGTCSYFSAAVAWAAYDEGLMCTDMGGSFAIVIEDDFAYSAAWGIDAFASVTTHAGLPAGGISLGGVPWTTKLQFMERNWGQSGAPAGRPGIDPPGWGGMNAPTSTVGQQLGLAIPTYMLLQVTAAERNAMLDKVVALGAKWIRFDVDWNDIEGTQGVFDWSEIDPIVTACTSRGLSIVGILGTCALWAQTGTPVWNHGPSTATQRSQFATFCTAAATHYAASIQVWEVWNEPNLNQFWDPTPSAASYGALLAAAYPAIKAGNASATVLTGGTGGTGGAPDIEAPDFVAGIYSGGFGAYFDAVAVHPYTDLATTDAATGEMYNAALIRATMNANGDSAMTLWGTETGAPTSLDYSVTEARQAALVGETWTAWKNIANTGPMFWYTLYDLAAAADREDFFGLYRVNHSAKPAVAAFQTLASTVLQ